MSVMHFIKNNYDSVPAYTPPGHNGTVNHRLMGPSVGSKHLEVIVGEMTPSGGAEPHVHEGFEQAIYMLEGRMKMWTPEAEGEFGPGDICLFPEGCPHSMECLEKSKFLVIYGPPKEKAE